MLQAFFTDRLTRQRHASPQTVAAYRDAWRLLLTFAAQRTGKQPCHLDIADPDAPLIGGFLDHLEHDRGNSPCTATPASPPSAPYSAMPPSVTPSTPSQSPGSQACLVPGDVRPFRVEVVHVPVGDHHAAEGRQDPEVAERLQGAGAQE